MPQLREDKKREILEFLGERAGEEKLSSLEVKRIGRRFADSSFDEDAVEDVIDELEADGLVRRRTAEMEVVYPTSHEEPIEEMFSHVFVSATTFTVFAVGTFLYFALLELEPLFEIVYQRGPDLQATVMRYTIFGIVSAYVLGTVGARTYGFVQDNVELLRSFRYVIYPTVVVGAVLGVIAIVLANYLGQSLTLAGVLTVLTGSVATGVTIGELILKNSESFESSP